MWMFLLIAVAGFCLSFGVLIPIFEWLLHRHAMHTKKIFKLFAGLYEYHDQKHHKIFDAGEYYKMLESMLNPVNMAGLSFNGWFMFGIVGIHAGLYLMGLLPLVLLMRWQWTIVLTLFIGLLAGSGVFGFFQIKFHYWYHADDGFGYTKLAHFPIVGRYFLYMCEHHRKHHKDTSKNLNTLVPTVDIFLHWAQKLLRPTA